MLVGALRAQVAAPGLPLVADRTELPDAEGRAVRASAGHGRKAARRAVLRPDRLPELVLVAPGRDEEEVEARPAAVEDHEPELAVGERKLPPTSASRRPVRASARISAGTGASAGAMSYHFSASLPP